MDETKILRWSSIVVAALGAQACASTRSAVRVAEDVTSVVQPGLVNTPALGTVRDRLDPPILDVIANGQGACESNAEGSVLRYKYPPCPNIERHTLPTQDVKRAQIAGDSGLRELRVWLPRSSSLWSCLEFPKPSLASPSSFVPVLPQRPRALACASPLDDGQ